MCENNKVVIVTGGTGDVGRIVVLRLANEGYKIYIPSRCIQKFKNIFCFTENKEDSKLKKIYSFECDALKENDVKKFIEDVAVLENGRIDILVNLIGGIHNSVFISEMNPEFFKQYFSLNFLAAFYFSHFVLKYMSAASYGRIISFSAMAAFINEKGKFAYSLSKLALIKLMDCISEEMKEYNIKCNTIVPSIIDTESNREWGSPEGKKKWVSPSEISEIILELISDKFNSVRESIIKVYGSF